MATCVYCERELHPAPTKFGWIDKPGGKGLCFDCIRRCYDAMIATEDAENEQAKDPSRTQFIARDYSQYEYCGKRLTDMTIIELREATYTLAQMFAEMVGTHPINRATGADGRITLADLDKMKAFAESAGKIHAQQALLQPSELKPLPCKVDGTTPCVHRNNGGCLGGDCDIPHGAVMAGQRKCPKCGNDYPHLLTDGSWYCDECGHRWAGQ